MASEIKMGISLDSSGVRKGLAKAKSSVKNFTTQATESFKTFTKVGVGALVAGFSVAARKSFSYAKEVENLSRISNTSIEDFQRNAHAAQTVGIEQEKLADIYKDTGDKIGDFLQTGGGPMVDYLKTSRHWSDKLRNSSGIYLARMHCNSILTAWKKPTLARTT